MYWCLCGVYKYLWWVFNICGILVVSEGYMWIVCIIYMWCVGGVCGAYGDCVLYVSVKCNFGVFVDV